MVTVVRRPTTLNITPLARETKFEKKDPPSQLAQLLGDQTRRPGWRGGTSPSEPLRSTCTSLEERKV
jgi:hypothetical protein